MTRRSPIVYNNAKDFEFKMCRISKCFNPQGNFSDVKLPFEFIVDEAELAIPAVRLEDLLDFDVNLLDKPDSRPEELKQPFERLLQMTRTCRNEQWTIDPTASNEKKEKGERKMIYIAKKVIIPLFGHICFERNYKQVEGQLNGAEVKLIGIGDKSGWYGTPDFRVRCCNFVRTDLNLIEEDQENSENSESEEDRPSYTHISASSAGGSSSEIERPLTTHIYWEGKQEINFREQIGQLVATAVVCSFTEHKLDASKNPAVPTIWINKAAFRICLYDCVNDVLLLSEAKSLTTNGTISRTAMFILWLLVHHR